MNWLDFLLISIVIIGTIIGYVRGLIISLATLIGFFLAAWAGLYASVFLASLWGADPQTEKQIIQISFIVTFVLVLILVLLIGKFVKGIATIVLLKPLDKFTGAIFGFARSVLIILFLMIINGSHDFSIIDKSSCDASVLYPQFEELIKLLPSEIGVHLTKLPL